MSLPRRTVLLGSLAAGGAALTGTLLCLGKGEDASESDPSDRAWSGQQLVDVLLAAATADVLQVAVEAMHAGVSRDQLLEAAYLLPVVSGGDVGDVHAMLAIPSVTYLADQASDANATMMTLWAVDNAHRWSKSERLPLDQFAAVEDPERALAEAIREQDPGRASLAVTSGISTLGAQAVGGFLRMHATARVTDPHVAIHAAQATRALERFGDASADLIFPSLARHIARATGSAIPRAEPMAPLYGTGARTLAEALKIAPNRLLLGTPPQAVWDALALLATDSRFAEPSGASGPAVHDTTLLDALLFCYEASASPDEKLQILQHSAYWLASLTSRYSTSDGASDGDGLPAATEMSDRRARVAERGSQPHDFKYQHAVESIGTHLSPAVARRFTAAAGFAPILTTQSRWERRDEALALIS